MFSKTLSQHLICPIAVTRPPQVFGAAKRAHCTTVSNANRPDYVVCAAPAAADDCFASATAPDQHDQVRLARQPTRMHWLPDRRCENQAGTAPLAPCPRSHSPSDTLFLPQLEIQLEKLKMNEEMRAEYQEPPQR